MSRRTRARATRRTVLAALGAGAVSLPGCVGRERPGSPTPTADDTPSGPAPRTPPGTTGSRTTTRSPAPDRLVLKRPETVPDDATLTVYPTDACGWLRSAAARTEPLRIVAETPVYTPEPRLATFDTVALDGLDAADGTYAVTAEGGTHYELLVGAEAVSSVPDGATVTPVSTLPDDRRRVARAAIEDTGDDRRVEPQTRLGEWVRHDFFGGYFEHEGTTYRGFEVQQTDAAFFSTALWLVLEVTPTTVEGPVPTLRCRGIDASVRAFVDPMLVEHEQERTLSRVATDGLAEPVVRFARETDYLLTHTAVFVPTVGRS